MRMRMLPTRMRMLPMRIRMLPQLPQLPQRNPPSPDATIMRMPAYNNKKMLAKKKCSRFLSCSSYGISPEMAFFLRRMRLLGVFVGGIRIGDWMALRRIFYAEVASCCVCVFVCVCE